MVGIVVAIVVLTSKNKSGAPPAALTVDTPDNTPVNTTIPDNTTVPDNTPVNTPDNTTLSTPALSRAAEWGCTENGSELGCPDPASCKWTGQSVDGKAVCKLGQGGGSFSCCLLNDDGTWAPCKAYNNMSGCSFGCPNLGSTNNDCGPSVSCTYGPNYNQGKCP